MFTKRLVKASGVFWLTSQCICLLGLGSLPAFADTRFVGYPPCPAEFFQHPGFGGRSFAIGDRCRVDYISNLGTFVMREGVFVDDKLDLNDKISSARVLYGMLVLYQYTNQKGQFIVLGNGSFDSLEKFSFNDRASSAAWYPGKDAPFIDNYYRHVSEPHVYWYGKNLTCRVTDPSQMERFGGFGKVAIVKIGRAHV